MSLSELPLQERPRERLVKEGADALSLQELVAIILGSGIKGKSVLVLSEEILKRFGSLLGVMDASLEELLLIKGLGQAKAIQLKAVFAIAKKSRECALQERGLIQTPEDAYLLIQEEIRGEKREAVFALLRDVRGRYVRHDKIAIGTLSDVLVHPREVFYPAVRHSAHSFILVHNHPSGDTSPSRKDLEVTRFLLDSSRIMGIALDDHLIATASSFVSLKKLGFFSPREIY